MPASTSCLSRRIFAAKPTLTTLPVRCFSVSSDSWWQARARSLSHEQQHQVDWQPFKTRGSVGGGARKGGPSPGYVTRASEEASGEPTDSLVNRGSRASGGSRSRPGRVIFSGIQPTGIPHLGNYIGALRQWKQYHEQSMNSQLQGGLQTEQYFSIVDLHALTAAIPREQRSILRKESYASLLAMGLTNRSSTAVFFQSDIPHHSELMWILSTIASTGYLSRMTQWKSKLNLDESVNLHSEEATAKLKLGLFSYPVLQAADILLYQTSLVPVGEDQLQHVEFTRTLARGFNSYLKEHGGDPVFNIPSAVLVDGKRIMSLKRPTQKMSKSDDDPKSRILITDSAVDVFAKIKGAVTDSEAGISYDPERRPGVSNLVEILKHMTNSPLSCKTIAEDHQNSSMRAFKEFVAEAVINELSGIRSRFRELMEPQNHVLQDEIHVGEKKAKAKASITFENVKRSLGLAG